MKLIDNDDNNSNFSMPIGLTKPTQLFNFVIISFLP